MKPHIQKVNGAWYCRYKYYSETSEQLRFIGGHKTPVEAYINFINARTAWLNSYPLIA